MNDGAPHPLLGDIAALKLGTSFGLVERNNMQRVVSFTANLHGVPLGDAVPQVEAAIRRAGQAPRGVTVAVRGQIPALDETISGLRIGLLLAIACVFLLLAANFQSFRLAAAVVLISPAVLCGVAIALLATGTTLSIQSFMGAIMAAGIATANSILMATFMELARRDGMQVPQAAIAGGSGRLRAVLMTAAAMIGGMLPIALGLGEGAEQTAPLGRAVIGGLLFGTAATLSVLPALYAIMQRRAVAHSPSLDPSDPTSRYYEAS
jgi:multidrug efflux pump subunit AcrB